MSDVPCRIWPGRLNEHGYGCIGRRLAHRVAWEKAHGPIPPRMQVLHSCDNPPCIEDQHLFLGTHVDNMRDMAVKGRRKGKAVGAMNPNAKLLPASVIAIRLLRGTTSQQHIASLFGISQTHVSKILSGKHWQGVA